MRQRRIKDLIGSSYNADWTRPSGPSVFITPLWSFSATTREPCTNTAACASLTTNRCRTFSASDEKKKIRIVLRRSNANVFRFVSQLNEWRRNLWLKCRLYNRSLCGINGPRCVYIGNKTSSRSVSHFSLSVGR